MPLGLKSLAPGQQHTISSCPPINLMRWTCARPDGSLPSHDDVFCPSGGFQEEEGFASSQSLSTRVTFIDCFKGAEGKDGGSRCIPQNFTWAPFRKWAVDIVRGKSPSGIVVVVVVELPSGCCPAGGERTQTKFGKFISTTPALALSPFISFLPFISSSIPFNYTKSSP